MKYILLLLLLTSCIPKTYNRDVYFFSISEKVIVLCYDAVEQPCGMTLKKCSNNVVYRCTNRVGIIQEEVPLF